MLRIIFKISFLLLSAVYVFPQGGRSVYDFRTINTAAGLSRTTVMAIHKDTEGYMWFGTANGLNKYDSYGIEVISDSPADSFALSDKSVNDIIEDDKGIIWMGMTDGSLNRLDKSTGIITHIPLNMSSDSVAFDNTANYQGPIIFARVKSNSVISLEKDSHGNLWVGTWGNGIKVYNIKNKMIRHIFHLNDDPFSIISNRITDFHVGSDSTVTVATFGGGINVLNITYDKYDMPFINYVSSVITDSKYFYDLFEDKDKFLWAGSGGSGLYKMEQNGEVPQVIKVYRNNKSRNSLTDDRVTSIDQDTSGCLWIGTFRGGISCLDPETDNFTNFKYDPENPGPVKDNEILDIYVDDFDVVWAGAHLGSGIIKIARKNERIKGVKKRTHYSQGLNDNIVWTITSTDSNTMWIGTYRGGLNKYDKKNNSFEYFTNDPDDEKSIPDDHIRRVTTDKYGNIWVGTYSGGVSFFNTKSETFTNFRHDPEDESTVGANQIISIIVDKYDTVWVGTYGGGLNYFYLPDFYQSGIINFSKYKNIAGDSTSIANNNVYSITIDKNEDLWLGLFGAGISKFDRNSRKFTNYSHDPDNDNSLGDNRIMVIHLDKKENLWIGTYGGGLTRYDQETNSFHRYNEYTGFYSNVIYGILEDDKNNLWLSSDNGIIKFNYNFFSLSLFDISDGLLSLEYSGGAYHKCSDGEMYFGGINGMNYFNPADMRQSFRSVPVLITKFKIFNKAVRGVRRSVELNYDQNFFSFEFAALDYSNNQSYNFSYTMEGLDDTWHKTTEDNRSVNYANLSPGNYTFRVRASNKYGHWSTLEDKVSLVLLPPFWMTWWFITALIVAGVLIIYGVFRARLHQLLAIERIKTKLAADLHDNIGAGLTEISIMSELTAVELRKASPSVSKRLDSISDTARLLVDSMSDIVWMVNPKRDSLRDLLIKLKDSYSDLLTHMGVAFKVSSFEDLENVKLSMEYKQNLYLIFKEGINNSIKHSRCNRISLEARLKGDGIIMMLKDDGVGMEVDNNNPGNGIKNMYNRATAIGGNVIFNASPENGTEIVFRGRFSTIGKLKSIFTD